MVTRQRHIPLFDADKVLADMTVKGWDVKRLAEASGLSHVTIRRFLDGSARTTKTAAKIAGALGFTTRRYFAGVGRAA
jgi:lambda repressor-like predicted transcriptional regulator